jgi:hypothetical protein
MNINKVYEYVRGVSKLQQKETPEIQTLGLKSAHIDRIKHVV